MKRAVNSNSLSFLLFISFVLFLSCFNTGHAQNMNNYTFSTGTNESLTDISSGSTQLIGASTSVTSSGVFSIGFDFLFAGQQYSQFSVNAKGVFQFGSSAVGTGTNIYNSPSSRDRIIPLVDRTVGYEMGTSSTGKVHYKVTGTSPDRVMIVEWLNMELFSGSGSADGTFQLRIYESIPGSTNSGRIDLVYGALSINNGDATTNYFTTGIGFGDGSTEYIGIETGTPTATVGLVTLNTYPSGTITDLNSASDGNRVYYYFNAASVSGSADNIASSCISSSSVNLSWTDNSTNEAAFVIYKSSDGGTTYSYEGQVTAGTTSYLSTGLSASTTYYYRVYAVTEGKFGTLSGTGQLSVTTSAAGSIYQIASGLWSDTGIWSSGAVPTSSDNVIVGCDSNYTLDIDGTSTCNNLTIESGSSLSFTASQQLTIVGDLSNSGSIAMDGGTLNIEGDFTNESTGTIYRGTTSTLAFTGSAGSQYTNNNPNITKTWTSSIVTSVAITDNGGNVATGNTVPSATDLTSCSFCTSVSVDLPAVEGAYTNLEAIYVNISHTWADDLNIYLLSPDNTVFVIATDQGGDNAGTAAYDNITFSDSGSALPGTGNTLTASSTYQIEVGTLSSYSGTFEGTWTLYVSDDANMDSGSILEFRVLAEETSSNIYFNDLTINNTGGLTLNNTVYVDNALTLTDGIINTSSTNLLILNDGATSTSGSSTSFVDGPMRKIGNDDFIFPVGDGSVWARIGIASITNTNFFTAQYFASSYSDVTNMGAGLNNVSKLEYWDLSRDFGSSTADLTLYFEDANRSAIDDLTDLRVAHYTGGAWENLSQTSTTANSITINGVSSFSPFTFGSNSTTLNPLPIELVYFKGQSFKNSNLLIWRTASEVNNEGFYIERSNDGVTWQELSFVDGNGTTTDVIDYQYVDKNVSYGISYYRLRQVDFDGAFEYSNIISLESDENVQVLNVYPIPASTQLTLQYTSLNEDKISIEVVDLLGRPNLTEEHSVTEGMNSVVLDVSDLSKGIYILKITNRGIEHTQRIQID